MTDFSKIRIAINQNDKIFHHSGLWTDAWIKFCSQSNYSFKEVDCYNPDIIEELKEFDLLLWHVGNYVKQDMMVGRSILYASRNMGLKVFPDFRTAWHFDDKIAETYLLQSINAPIPKTWMFYILEDCINWLKKEVKYPIVAKLRCGSGSTNVKILETESQAISYAKHLFGKGYKTYPSLIFKTTSQIKSAKNVTQIYSRLRKIPEFLRTLSNAKKFPPENGYVLFQEFIPNDGYDLKIVVIGNKLSYIGRKVRKGDFRASGGGDLFFEKTLVTSDIIQSAFVTNEKLGFQCMGFDYVVDKNDGKGKIVEMSYGFSYQALMKAGGYWDRNGEWVPEPLNAPEEVLKNLLNAYNI